MHKEWGKRLYFGWVLASSSLWEGCGVGVGVWVGAWVWVWVWGEGVTFGRVGTGDGASEGEAGAGTNGLILGVLDLSLELWPGQTFKFRHLS